MRKKETLRVKREGKTPDLEKSRREEEVKRDSVMEEPNHSHSEFRDGHFSHPLRRSQPRPAEERRSGV